MVTTMAVGVSEVKLLEQGQELQGIIREAVNLGRATARG